MKTTREYWISGNCPYCERSFSIFTGDPSITQIYQCMECSRGLTIMPVPMHKVLIEAGTPKQCFGECMVMPEGNAYV